MKHKRKHQNALMIGVLATLLILASACGSKKPLPTEPVMPSVDPNIEDNVVDGDDLQAELDRQMEESQFRMIMNESPIFEDGKAEGNLLISNPKDSGYIQEVSIVRKDTNEEVYHSAAMKPGDDIEYDRLAVDLDAGTYECIAYFSVSTEDGAYIGTIGAGIKLTVLN